MPESIQSSCQVVVIGGGPAGSTAATLVAQQGVSVQLFERERFPRFHIGESLIPETYWVIERLNLLETMKQSHFIRKYSVQFVNASGKISQPFYFLENNPHECSQTWQVRRSEFDEILLNNARKHGVSVHEGVRVLEVLFEGERAVGVRVQEESGAVHEVRAEVVIDASGQSSMIMSRLGLREWDPELKKAAVWTYWRGAHRDTGQDEGATIVLQLENKEGWFWYIPLHDDIVSVGVVAGYDYLFKNRATKDHEAIYFEEVARCSDMGRRLAGAERADGFRAAKEYSYRAKQAAGDGWVLVGDAFGFLDPLYSSGVLLALHSGQRAADAVVAGLASGDTSAAVLGAWEPDFRKGMDRMRRLVMAYYNGFSFGCFVKRHPFLRGPLTAFLLGDLFKDDLDTVLADIDIMQAEIDAEQAEAASSDA